jgi:hypothetical protein
VAEVLSQSCEGSHNAALPTSGATLIQESSPSATYSTSWFLEGASSAYLGNSGAEAGYIRVNTSADLLATRRFSAYYKVANLPISGTGTRPLSRLALQNLTATVHGRKSKPWCLANGMTG